MAASSRFSISGSAGGAIGWAAAAAPGAAAQHVIPMRHHLPARPALSVHPGSLPQHAPPPSPRLLSNPAGSHLAPPVPISFPAQSASWHNRGGQSARPCCGCLELGNSQVVGQGARSSHRAGTDHELLVVHQLHHALHALFLQRRHPARARPVSPTTPSWPGACTLCVSARQVRAHLRLREAVLELRVVLQRLHLLHHAAALRGTRGGVSVQQGTGHGRAAVCVASGWRVALRGNPGAPASAAPSAASAASSPGSSSPPPSA